MKNNMIHLEIEKLNYLTDNNGYINRICCFCKYNEKIYIEALSNMFKIDDILITNDYYNYIICDDAKIIDVNKLNGIHIDIDVKYIKSIEHPYFLRKYKINKLFE